MRGKYTYIFANGGSFYFLAEVKGLLTLPGTRHGLFKFDSDFVFAACFDATDETPVLTKPAVNGWGGGGIEYRTMANAAETVTPYAVIDPNPVPAWMTRANPATDYTVF